VLSRTLAVAVTVVVLAVAFVVVQLLRPVPRPVLRVTAAASVTVAGPVPAVAWPRSGQAAVAVVGIGSIGSAGASTPVPIASLAKVMTALVVLHDHPLSSGQSGPEVAITAGDQATYDSDVAAGDSVAPVVAGESLAELQLLEGLLIPSADNLADVVAQWDAGSDAAFVAKMNSMAASLAMRATHYADPGGVSTGTVSTAADQLRLAETVVSSPTLMSIVRMSQVSLPNSGVLKNYDSLLGQDGIVGIKTGSTSAAGGCFMFAADSTVGGHPVRVLGVVLGQTGTSLITAGLDASPPLIHSVLAALRSQPVLTAGTSLGEIVTPWGPAVSVVAAKAITTLRFGQTAIRQAVEPQAGPIARRLPAGSVVATVSIRVGAEVETVPAVTSTSSSSPSLRWRVERV